MIQTAEDDEFDRIEHENEMKSGQPYIFDVYVCIAISTQLCVGRSCQGV